MKRGSNMSPTGEVRPTEGQGVERMALVLLVLRGIAALARMKSDTLKTVFTWWVVIMIAVVFLIYAFIAFVFIGQKWPPPWRFGTVADVPGLSVYSSREAQEGAALGQVQQERVQRQHVMGLDEEKTEKKLLWEFLKSLGDDSGLPGQQKQP